MNIIHKYKTFSEKMNVFFITLVQYNELNGTIQGDSGVVFPSSINGRRRMLGGFRKKGWKVSLSLGYSFSRYSVLFIIYNLKFYIQQANAQ